VSGESPFKRFKELSEKTKTIKGEVEKRAIDEKLTAAESEAISESRIV
jgi:hypothetical protein